MESQQVGSLGDYTRALFLAVRDLLFGCAPMINSKEGHRQMNNDEHDIAIRYRGWLVPKGYEIEVVKKVLAGSRTTLLKPAFRH